MPAYKCDNGKYRWGATGSCKYNSKQEAEDDNKDYYRALTDIDLTPTQGMIDEAKKGLEWRKEFGRGGTEVGIRTARMIINNELTPDRVTRMFSFHSRHQVDKEAEGYNSGEKGYPSNGRIAIALWGGDAGFSWSERKREEIVEEEEKRVSAKIKTALENKRDEHNEEIKELSLDWDASVNLPMLEKVFDRGVGAYNTNPQSVRPTVKSPEQWALARVGSFLYAMKKGKFRSGKHDTDLLPSNHPVKKEMEEKMNNMKIEKRHIREIIEDEKSFIIVYVKSDEWEGYIDNDMTMQEEEVMEESYHYDKEEEEDEKTFRNNNPNVEKRTFNLESKIETREVDGKERNVVVGYGSVYNSRSENLGGFYEYISEGAFTDELINSSDVRALINHDPNLILARSKNGKGTLKLKADAKVLRYEFEMPDTSYARDLLINMKNNNLNQSSFAFTIPSGGDEWSSDEAGNNIRTINKIDRLFDISVVTYPAYSQADSDVMVAQRGLKEYKETKKLVKHSLLGLKIEINKRK